MTTQLIFPSSMSSIINIGANFARASNVTATLGKNEGITQSFTNHNISHALKVLEEQMKRFEKGTAMGMWEFAAYVLSEDQNIANNVAHTYLALTQGEESFMSQSSVNLWRGDLGESSGDAEEIVAYLRELRHPYAPERHSLSQHFEEYGSHYVMGFRCPPSKQRYSRDSLPLF